MTDKEMIIAFALRRKGKQNIDIALAVGVSNMAISRLFTGRVPVVHVPDDWTPERISEEVNQMMSAQR